MARMVEEDDVDNACHFVRIVMDAIDRMRLKIGTVIGTIPLLINAFESELITAIFYGKRSAKPLDEHVPSSLTQNMPNDQQRRWLFVGCRS